MKIFKRPKVNIKRNSPPPPRNLSELIDRLTTGGNRDLDAELLSELSSKMRASESSREDALRFIFQQIKRPHAQIRLSVVKVIRYLSSQSNLSLLIREAVLLQLQDLFPFCVPTANTDKPLPPPEMAANELQREIMELLLSWEKDASLDNLTSQARGQLSSLLRYLRSPLKQGNGNSRLKSAAQLLEQLEREEAQRKRNSLTADAIIRRRVTEARDSFRENREAIEENLRSLGGAIKLLVPDIFELDSEKPLTCFSPRDFREHGMHESGEVNISLSMHLAISGKDRKLLLPEIRVFLNEENRLLQATGRGFLNLAQGQHRAILDKFLELSRIFEANPELSALLAEDRAAVESLSNRLEQTVNQFLAIRFIEDENEDAKSCNEDSDVDDDEFVDVPPLSDGHEIPSTSKPCSDSSQVLNKEGEKPFSKPMVFLMDKLPWELEGRPTSSNSKNLPLATTRFRIGHSEASSISKYVMKRRLKPVEESIILPPEDPKALIWKANESLHRFWKPIDTSEFEAPDFKMEEDAISFLPSTSRSTPKPAINAHNPAEQESKECLSTDHAATTASRDLPKIPAKKFKPLSVAERVQQKEAARRRRRYPNLVDVSDTPKSEIDRLKKRVLNPRGRNRQKW